MIDFIISWLPLILALLFLWKSKARPAWRFGLAFIIYVFAALVLSIGEPVVTQLMPMISAGTGNANLVAATIAEKIIRAILRMVIDVPIMAVFLWFVSRHPAER